MQIANILVIMKNSIFLSSLLAVCVTCVAHADDVNVTSYKPTGDDTVNGNLNATSVDIGGSDSTVIIEGNLTANTFVMGGSYTIDVDVNGDVNCKEFKVSATNNYENSFNTGGNFTSKKVNISGSDAIISAKKITISPDDKWTKAALNLTNGSTLKAESIYFNVESNKKDYQFSILGGSTVNTDSLILSAAEGCKGELQILDSKLDNFESGSEEKGTLEIGANFAVNVSGSTEDSSTTIGMNTVVDGGTLNVEGYTAMSGITLNSGAVNISNSSSATYDSYEYAMDLGDITVENGTLSLEEAAIASDVTMNSGELNIIGDVETGALTLNGGTINFSADSTIDLGEENLILGDNVAITLNVNSLDNIEGVTLFKNSGNVSGLDKLSVTFRDATGAEKKAAVSFSNGSVVTGTVPEPTTATLSLLALAGLAARRRRK